MENDPTTQSGLSLSTVDGGANVSGGSAAGPGPDGYRVGDMVDALCTPVGAPPEVKKHIKGEVAHRNPDGSVDVILSDGRMRPDVPLSELRFIDRPKGGEGHVGSADTNPAQGDNSASGGHVGGIALSDAEAKRRADNWKADMENDDAAVDSGKGSRDAGGGRVEGATRGRKSSLDDILGMKMAAMKPAGAKTLLEKGDVVKALGVRSMGGSAPFSVGVIHHQHEDDFFDIELEDGRMVTRLPRSGVLLQRKGQPQSSSSIDVGDRVEARYGYPEVEKVVCLIAFSTAVA